MNREGDDEGSGEMEVLAQEVIDRTSLMRVLTRDFFVTIDFHGSGGTQSFFYLLLQSVFISIVPGLLSLLPVTKGSGGRNRGFRRERESVKILISVIQKSSDIDIQHRPDEDTDDKRYRSYPQADENHLTKASPEGKIFGNGQVKREQENYTHCSQQGTYEGNIRAGKNQKRQDKQGNSYDIGKSGVD